MIIGEWLAGNRDVGCVLVAGRRDMFLGCRGELGSKTRKERGFTERVGEEYSTKNASAREDVWDLGGRASRL